MSSVKKLKLSEWQEQFLSRYDDPLVIAMTGISAGKTRILAIWIVLQSYQKKGLRSIVIAQTYRILSLVLVKEIETVCMMLNIPIEINKSSYTIKFANGSIIYSFSSENPTAVLGLSNIDALLIDESAYCNEQIYNFARDRMRGSTYNTMVRLISSPQNGDVSNWFGELVKRYPSAVIRATAYDNPFTEDSFKAELKERWIEGSNLYRQQVLGEILDIDATDSLVNTADLRFTQVKDGGGYWMGVDVAGQGEDKTAIVVRNDVQIVYIAKWQGLDTLDIVNEIKKANFKYKCERIYIDNTGGFGQGVYDILKTSFNNIIPVNFAERAIRDDLYSNQRTEIYKEMAGAIKNGFNVLSENKELIDEIKAQRMFVNNSGRLALKPKENIRNILGRSPDSSDALALSFCKKEIVVKTATVNDVDIMISRMRNNFIQ